MNDPKKTLEIMQKAKKKAEEGFSIDKTFVRFYVDDQKNIDVHKSDCVPSFF